MASSSPTPVYLPLFTRPKKVILESSRTSFWNSSQSLAILAGPAKSWAVAGFAVRFVRLRYPLRPHRTNKGLRTGDVVGPPFSFWVGHWMIFNPSDRRRHESWVCACL